MAVLIGNASISENGTIKGKAGDQTGKEVTTRKWYKHSKGWYAMECLIPGMEEYIAEAMEMACANPDIGYNQYENQTLWNNVAPYGYDPSKTTKKVNTDCARLVRLCIQYACVKMGLDIIIPDFYTATMVSVLEKTGLFRKLSDPKYTAQDLYLRRGWPMVTRTKGHAIVVLENGKKAGATTIPDGAAYVLGSRLLRNGDKGPDVKELQSLLIQLGYDLGSWGADSDFGDMTEMAVREFQKDNRLEVDGVVGEETYGALMQGNDAVPDNPTHVLIEGGNCYIRSAPNTDGKILGTAYMGMNYAYLGETSENGWHKIRKDSIEGYVSGKYGKLEG